MNILVFDCSSELLAVGLARKDGRLFSLAEKGFRHTELLLPCIGRCLEQAALPAASLDLIACTGGPGSFTGLRIGISTAKGLALALGKPWVSLPTLDCIAFSLTGALEPYSSASPDRSRTVVPVLDARKKRLYAAVYRQGRRESEYLDISIEGLLALVDADEELCFVGQGADFFTDYTLERSGFSIEALEPERLAAAMALLALKQYREQGPAVEDEAPLYIREPEIG
ncbi:MAG: tRNA (adenosine(37)-N6)-threonylcarbamoyltransferase complex dimerization subunit type 1 TsaB [Spirochaetia bacterium]|jgi:tRNA threonylcarbamoyladenosine biosynthesis protein TsaB|nr:tRNA (adenosine(37)-N6)-threonylcarbamoyltransferase complex dimerization subunit type 1 TsaB [Spirochaetia bacterium]